MAGIYLHIPFCKQACHYCDFHFSTELSQMDELIRLVSKEAEIQKSYLGQSSIETIYFGGGTPSLLDFRNIQFLLTAVRDHFSVDANSEITLEVNPDDLSEEKIAAIKGAGINRLSIGIQSFDNALLKFLNRAHDAESARRCLSAVRKAGFTNISIDLIYAIPGLTDELWNQTLHAAMDYAPEHISAYALTIEDRTVFGNWSKRGKIVPMDDDHAARQYELLMDTLEKNGYQHYEISNFSKPGLYSRHNSSYWKDTYYLGLGPGAHSYNGLSRQFNVRNNPMYVRELNKGSVPFERETLTRENQINEFILTRLRTMWGCGLRELKERWGDDLLKRSGADVTRMEALGLVKIENEVLFLTRKGKLVADKIASDLIL